MYFQGDSEKEQAEAVSLELKRKASDFLRTAISDVDKEYLVHLYNEKSDEHWFSELHFTSGMTIRNMLREHGFGEDKLGVENLDYIYVELLEMAIGIHKGKGVVPTIRKIRV